MLFSRGIRRALNELPKTLDQTYERILEVINEEKWEYTLRLFQCLEVARRPLRVKELADVLAVERAAHVEIDFLERSQANELQAKPIPTYLPIPTNFFPPSNRLLPLTSSPISNPSWTSSRTKSRS